MGEHQICYQLGWLRARNEIEVNCRKRDFFFYGLEKEYLTWGSTSFLFYAIQNHLQFEKLKEKHRKLNVKGESHSANDGLICFGTQSHSLQNKGYLDMADKHLSRMYNCCNAINGFFF